MLVKLQRLALVRAFRGGGSRTWLIIGTAAWLVRTANRLRAPVPEVVFRGTVEPGERLVVDHLLVDQGGHPVKRRRRGR
ncbi:MAG: hypothetical protein ACXIVQ_01605 [Acidimicrobiales bacterium]